jgi:ATP-binding cassette, subfamily B, multidrug efflux pump
LSTEGKTFDFAVLRRLYRKGQPYRKAFVITGLLVLVLAVIAPVRPGQMRQIVDVFVPQGDHAGILRVSLLFVGVLLFESLVQFAQTWIANRVAQSVTLDLRGELYAHIMKFRMRYFDRTPVGQFVTRLIGDIDGIAEVFSVGILDIVRDILKLVVIITYMFWVDWQLTLMVLLPVPVLLFATRLFQQAVQRSFQEVRNQVARINVFIQEHVSGMSIVQIFNRERIERDKFHAINARHRDAHIRAIWAYSVFFPVVELLSAASVSLMLWWGLGDALSGHVSPGLLLEFSMFITMMYRPIRQMADNINVLQMGMVNANRVFRVLDEKEAQNDEGTLEPEQVRGDIRFNDVWFAYTDEQWVLRGISLHARPGSMIAVVGATGAGKSSLAGLLNRTYEHQRGEVLLDNNPVDHYPLDWLRTRIALVPQDVFLFADSILNNITLFDETITHEDVVRASREVGTHEFIQRLPGGYDFQVGERGAMLSTGQRQLIAFVRAYVRNPSVLILDEATSSVDGESEMLIRLAMDRLTQGRTSIVIAHRLSTVRKADTILVMEKGQIAEQGSHDELMKSEGIYHRLVSLQFEPED